MNTDLKQWVSRYWLIFFLIIVFMFMAIFKISFKDIWRTISSLKLWQFGLLFSVYVLVSCSLVISRKYLLHSLSSPSRLKNLLLIHFSSRAAHYSTPAKLGFPFTVYLLKRFENIPYTTGTVMVLIEVVVGTGICGVIAFFGSYFYFSEKTNTLLPLLLFFVIPMVTLPVIGHILKKKAGNSRFYRFIKDVHCSFSHLDTYHSLLYFLIMTFIQVFSGINLVLLAYFFSADLTIWQAVVAQSAAFFLGALSMVPMGLGVREASVLFFLYHVGVPKEVGLSIVTIQRLLSTGLNFTLGIIFGTVIGVKNIRL
ncbi:MAG: flippase-like domain-containing protein [Deltaproteobacteria bacterium]|nr:flippase-like domain-containing protein [Deltaproteobacteria bacterium]MBW2077824.1 flippase-like domain-containing protein [Deltaproteobacteria bacterium]